MQSLLPMMLLILILPIRSQPTTSKRKKFPSMSPWQRRNRVFSFSGSSSGLLLHWKREIRLYHEESCLCSPRVSRLSQQPHTPCSTTYTGTHSTQALSLSARSHSHSPSSSQFLSTSVVPVCFRVLLCSNSAPITKAAQSSCVFRIPTCISTVRVQTALCSH